MTKHIAVVGAGAVGLSTAVNIQKRLPNAVVTVIADDFGNDTTSGGVGGLLRVDEKYMGNENLRRLNKWFNDSFQEYDRIVHTEKGHEKGIYPITGFNFTDQPESPTYKKSVYAYHDLTPSEIDKLGILCNNKNYGFQVCTLYTEGSRFVNYLMEKFKQNGGVFVKKRLTSLEELLGTYDVVAHCSGLGARYLVGDLKVHPRRGQLIKVHAPWVKQFIFAAGDTYIYPLIDCVALGSVDQKDNYNLSLSQEDSKAIFDRCCKIMPSLKNAKVLSEWVGLRPARDPLRLEKEVMKFKSGSLKVVHNYGHGRYGVCLSWGTGMEAAEKVEEFLSENTVLSKL